MSDEKQGDLPDTDRRTSAATLGLLDKPAARIVICLAIVALGVVFALCYRLPTHVVVQTGENTHTIGPVTSDAAFVQEIDSARPARVTAVEVLLATWGEPANTTRDELRIFDGSGREIRVLKLAPGTVTDNTYVRVDLQEPLNMGQNGRFFVVLSSSDGSESESITAWATSEDKTGGLYSLPAANLAAAGDVGQESLAAIVDAASPIEGAICVRVYGQGWLRLRIEKEVRAGGSLVLLAIAACVWWAGTLRRWWRAGRASFPSQWEKAEKRFAASKLSRVGRRLSEDHLIRLDLKTQLFCAIGLLLFIVLVVFKMHGSSVEMWNNFVPSDAAGVTNSSLIAGSPKAIRSDEWLVATPQLLQEYTDPEGQQASEIAVDVVSPWNWGFHVLGLERGFSFMWDFWVLGSICAFFLLVMLLTDNRFGVSLFSSLFLFLSSYNRWWDVTVYVTTFSFVLVGLYYFLQSRKRLNIWLGFALVCVFGLKFVLLLYPAWQVTLVYLMLFILVGALLQKGSRDNLRAHFHTKVALATVGLAVAAGVGALGYFMNQETIGAMLNTVYPGERISVGGDVGLLHFFSGYLDPLLGSPANDSHFFAGNMCESAAFILLFPFVFIAVLLEKRLSKNWHVKPVALGLIVYLIALSAYMLFGYGRPLSRVLLLSYVPGTRALIGLGIASILLVATYVAKPPSDRVPPWAKTVLGVLTFGALTAFSIGFQKRYGYPDWVAALPVCLALAIAVSAMLFRTRGLFYAVMLLLVAVPSVNSNPVSVGLEPIYGKRLVQAVAQLAAENPDERWLVYGDLFYPEIVRASGADVFNGTRFPPELETMHELDPTGAYAEVWNRYAHIQAMPGHLGSPEFALVHPDVYTMALSPDEPALAAADVELFAAPVRMQGMFPSPAFQRLTPEPLNGYLIFERAAQ
jgi:hypothetical protein